ncbi:MAG: chromosomal replication initiator protein DnaA [Rhizobiaceae bacterium]|nr:chromosomal replication initiator protein DnaA [Rhizobiaceae bacterium]
MGRNGAGKRSLGESWDRVRAQLEAQLGKDVFDSWFGRLKLAAFEGGVVTLTVPTPFLKNWIQSKYREKLLELWQAEDSSALRVDVAVRKPIAQKAAEEEQGKEAAKSNAETAKTGKFIGRTMPTNGGQIRNLDFSSGFPGSPLDPKHTFETFIEGSSNRMVYAAAQTIAEDITASHFNPLFIHANVGLGKTHLLQAIAWRARSRNPKARVLYLTAEYFMWRFASALRDKTALTLKESLRDIDILLIDDMQFLQGQAIQAEFCHLLNELIDSARQVVVAADRPATELESLDERVRSRLKGGVTLEVKMPDYELRKQILNSRYEEARREQPGLDIPEDILHYVARQVSSSGRDIEGAFNQLLVQHQFSDGAMSFDELDKILAHLVKSAESKRVRIEDIQRIVARQFNVSKNDLLSNRRTRVIVRPRQIAMYLAKVMTPRSLPEIGRRFGGRDHTTVLHAVRKIEELSSNDQKIAHEIELLKRLILE